MLVCEHGCACIQSWCVSMGVGEEACSAACGLCLCLVMVCGCGCGGGHALFFGKWGQRDAGSGTIFDN